MHKTQMTSYEKISHKMWDQTIKFTLWFCPFEKLEEIFAFCWRKDADQEELNSMLVTWLERLLQTEVQASWYNQSQWWK
jgi:hypothetical protein